MANTSEVVNCIYTHSLVLARLSDAVINVHFTELSCETRLADTHVRAYSINTSCIVQAFVVFAFINI